MIKDTAALDLLGVGFGPAGIAVATAVDDAEEFLPAGAPRMRTLFVERAGSAAWQPNMLLPGTDIQHHYLRDFACPRDPRSRFTFANFLKETGRFYPFTLMGGYVSRQDWSAYVEWTAGQLTQPVRYRHEVVEATPVLDGDAVVAARVHSRDTGTGEVSEHLARNVLVSTGHQAYVPDLFASHVGPRMFHASQFLPNVQDLAADAPLRFAVVGAGQNAGEILLHLAQAFPQAQIHSLARNSGFRMYNLGHFSNEAYFPAETDYFYALGREQRSAAFAEVYSTNYACVDPDVSTALYRTVYEDRFFGRNRMHVRKRTAVDACVPLSGGGYRLSLREVNTGAGDVLDADVVILCTGFREPRLPELLEPFRPYLEFDEAGDPVVSRDYRLQTRPGCGVGLYLNGITEWRHGINSATSFSVMAVKAEQILRDLRTRLGLEAPRPDESDADPLATALRTAALFADATVADATAGSAG